MRKRGTGRILGMAVLLAAAGGVQAADPDLTVQQLLVRPSVTVAAGDRIGVQVRIRRDGLTSATPVEVAAYLCPTPNNRGCVFLGRTHTRSTSARWTVMIPARGVAVQPGTRYLRVWVDPRNQVRERNENNNIVWHRLMVRRRGATGGAAAAVGAAASQAPGAGALRQAANATRRLDPGVLRQIQEENRRMREALASSRGGEAMLQLQQAARGMLQALNRLAAKTQECTRRSYSAADDRAAGCSSSDTVAECTRKRIDWCTARERGAVRRAAGRLTQARQTMEGLLGSVRSCEWYGRAERASDYYRGRGRQACWYAVGALSTPAR